MKSSILVLLLIGLFSCAENGKMEIADASSGTSVDQTSQVAALADNAPGDPRSRLIKTAEYRFRVNSLKKSVEKIENAVKKFPAQIASSNLTLQGSTLESSITIRVQSEFFNDLLKIIDEEPSYINYRNIKTEDVAKQFVDLESRLKTKREVQERFKEILRTKAGTIDELLAAERQIGEMQEEIEATVSRLDYLKDQVAHSTIKLELYENISNENIAANDDNVFTAFRDAFFSGLNGTVDILIALTHLWPAFLIVAITWLFYRKRKKVTLAERN